MLPRCKRMSNLLPLPLTSEALTAEWLTAALAPEFPGSVVESVRVADVMTGTSTKIRIALGYNVIGRMHGLPATLIVKGGFEPHSPQLWGVNRAETSFYGNLQHRITMRSPRCYYAGLDPDGYQSVIILEDLDVRGVTWLRYGSREGVRYSV